MGLFNWGKKKPPKQQPSKTQIVCPYCMGKINPKDILFLANKSDGQVDEVFFEFASRYQGFDESNQMQAHLGQLISQNDSELNVQVEYSDTSFPTSLRLQRNGGEARTLTTRVCPHCHCYLPTDIEKMNTKSIVLLGSTSCGKTTLIAGMLYMLVGDLTEDKPSPHISKNLGTARIEKDSLSFARKMMETSLLNAERDPTEIAKPIFPIVLVAQDAVGNNKTLVTIHDFAGEGLDDEEYFLNHSIGKSDYVTDGILYAIDTCQLPDLSNFQIAHACTEEINNAIVNFSEQQKRVLSRADALAVTLTKFDVYNRFVGQHVTGHVYEPLLTSHTYGVNISTIKDVSNTVKKILDPAGGQHIIQRQIENVFNRKTHGTPELESVEYFATACLKSTGGDGMGEESTAAFDATCLHRVCEPLLYMFAKWGIFSVKK